ncbi:hypothetical protein CKM354_000830500 [Cercospora kikuchii]|uniref:Peptidase C14 caspase domain-containing protein n=1 Tax=Cercospora kikuchii TaxID=84275 RepID=A0A9P3FF58_9PEZI|nr:uncharacterized protein CKM354_000830500 [Cercospora kikuchii]GIZ45123.1 hypothetical protein CKM354_000830500 [Cercospora kikuchii]
MPAIMTSTKQVHTETVIRELDVLESPRTRRRRETSADRNHRHYDDLRVTFEKTIKGRYRNGSAIYDKVGVLLITWHDDDMNVWAKEVQDLATVFQKTFSFEVEHYRIPTQRAVTGVNAKVAEFAHRFDSSDSLGIVYYGGHGAGDDQGRLSLYARAKENYDGHVHVPFDDITHHLHRCDADILVITDCCHAALAFGQAEVGKRRFEIITATGPGQDADAPTGTKSFTKILCTALEELAPEPTGFTTSKLYRNVYHKADASRKPFLFDQSIHDWGRIWMQPLKDSRDIIRDDWQPSAQGDACVHLELRMRAKPKLKTMNDLARELQFLPHVKEVTFRKMHAPRLEIEGFMTGVTQAMKIRPLIKRLRKRLEEKRIAEGRDRIGVKTPPPAPSYSPLLYNWNESFKDPQDPDDEGISEAQENGVGASHSRNPSIEVHGPVTAWPQPHVDELIGSEPPASACYEAANVANLPSLTTTNGTLI